MEAGGGSMEISEKKISNDVLIDMAQYSFTRLDGAWFLAVAEKYGIDTAWEMDVAAWTRFAYGFGKKIRTSIIPDPVWPDSFIEALQILSDVLKIEGRNLTMKHGEITVRVTDCETQKMIAKAGIADCGIVTVQTYQGIFQGLFGKDKTLHVEHRKNLNRGDDCCEVVVRNPGL